MHGHFISQYKVNIVLNILTWTGVSNEQPVCCSNHQDKALDSDIGETHTKWLEEYIHGIRDTDHYQMLD